MELEFVRSVNISSEKAPLINSVREKNNVVLTCHAPYFINLNSPESKKVDASLKRIFDSAKIASLCGAWSVCFHPGFYLSSSHTQTFDVIKKQFSVIESFLDEHSLDIWVRPETTGKPSAFGSFDELVELCSSFDKILPCVDFAHVYARSSGSFNSTEEWNSLLSSYEKHLGKQSLQKMHIHLSGIAYSDKGEKHHLVLKESNLKYVDLLKVLKDFSVKGVVVCESPNLEQDALLLKSTFENL